MSRSKILDLLSESHRRYTSESQQRLQKLLRRAANQESWTAQLQALLPEPLCRDCRVMDVRGDTVVVVCRNAASATRLRFMTDEILKQLSYLGDFRGAKKMRIRVSSA